MKKIKKYGYQAFRNKQGKKITTHSRIGEKKYRYGKIPKDFVIHHIDEDKDNNQYYNLILIHKKDHRRIHVTKSLVIKSVKPSENQEEE